MRAGAAGGPEVEWGRLRKTAGGDWLSDSRRLGRAAAQTRGRGLDCEAGEGDRPGEVGRGGV